MTAAAPLDPERLAAIEARDADWDYHVLVPVYADRRALLGHVQWQADTITRLEAQEQRIRALHRRDGSPVGVCIRDFSHWPCPTIRALDGAG